MQISLDAIGVLVVILIQTAGLGYFGGSISRAIKHHEKRHDKTDVRLERIETQQHLRRSDDH